MALLDELISLLETAGVGTEDTDIFQTSKSLIPAGVGPYLSLVETGGTAPENTHNAVSTPAYQRPTVQILVRAESPADSAEMIRAAYDALVGVRNTTVSSVFYREIRPMQEPTDLGLDSTGRHRMAFNVMVVKRPS